MKAANKNNAFVSIVVPVYNEAQNIVFLHDRISENLDGRYDYEIILVDDGSSDTTLQKIGEIRVVNKKVHYIALSRNFGHQNALKAGLDHCRGDVVISMDGDLQHPPELIPKMLAYWHEGYDVVVTVREDRDTPELIKKFSSRWFYRVLNRISSIDLTPGAADFRLLDRKVVDTLKSFGEKDLFYRGFVSWVGYKQMELPYKPNKRVAGTSKYTLRKMVQLAANGLMGFSILPLRVVSLLGCTISVLSFSYGFYAILIRFFSDQAVSGWASVMTGIYFLGGIQLICIGICGEYIGRVFLQVKGRPSYIVTESSLLDQRYTDRDVTRPTS